MHRLSQQHLRLPRSNSIECGTERLYCSSSFLSSVIGITLRTFLNQEYKCRIPLDQTVSDLKQAFAKQENLDPQWIVLTKQGNFFQELDDNRTLKSYGCDASAVLMVCIRRWSNYACVCFLIRFSFFIDGNKQWLEQWLFDFLFYSFFLSWEKRTEQ